MSTGVPSETVKEEAGAGGQSSPFAALDIEIANINTAPGVQLSESQKLLVGSVLNLFKGKPSLKRLQLWTDDATFNDPLTTATGRKQYSAQWYGLAAAFSAINQLSHTVTDSGNPICLDLKTNYRVKYLGTEKAIESVVKIHTDAAGDKIVGVEDRWNGEIPEGPIAKVFRNLNSVLVPQFVGVPKNEEEDSQKGL